MMPTNGSVIELFEQAINDLPPELASISRDRLENLLESPGLSDTLNKANSTGPGQQILMSLPRVLATSEFISHTLHRAPDLFENLLSIDSVLVPRDQKDIGKLLLRDYTLQTTLDQLMLNLRNIRRREVVRIGWRDIAGFASLNEVVETLSQLADECIKIALDKAQYEISIRHGTPIGADSHENIGLVVLGLGKLGGRELNFSSDVDLIFAYPESGTTNGHRSISNQEFFVKVGQLLIRILDEITPDGFVFRTDMRLRPNGDSGPLALSFDAINHYYITHGREWERFALIKARAVAGNIGDGRHLLEILRPFVYRKYLDFGAFDALRSMKHRIERELLRKNSIGDIKRGSGGIREIEFIVQTHQLIRGGRDLALQTESLGQALAKLEKLSLIHPTHADELRIGYDFLRKTEHRLQAAEDLQTHQLPTDLLKQQQLAVASGFFNWNEFETHLNVILRSVHQRFQELFTPENNVPNTDQLSEWLDVWQNSLEPNDANIALTRGGFNDPDHAVDLLEGLRNSHFYHAFSRMGRDRLDRLMPAALAQCSESNQPMIALTRLISVIEAIGRRSAYLALLSENPLALSQLIKLITASQSINSWISQHPVILDELLDPISSYQVQSENEIGIELAGKLTSSSPLDLEVLMDQLREFRQGHTLRLAAADVANIVSQTEVSDSLCSLAEVLLAQSLKFSATSLQPESHSIDIQGIGVIAYGKLGSRELSYNSDLDLIFLFENPIKPPEAGPHYRYSRLLQRLIHILTTRTSAGQLYEIDTRLRPDGRSGIVINPVNSFLNYQLKKAQVWEHQALVRARIIIGSESLTTAFNDCRHQVLCLARNEMELRKSVVSMRSKIIREHCRSTEEEYDLKVDRGGLLDIEFLLQYLILRWANQYPQLTKGTKNKTLIRALVDTRILASPDGEVLGTILDKYLRTENLLKLQEKLTLIPKATLIEERKWISQLWQRFLEPDR
jgi:glutamate-ammonia-ligase adenylyltransferase